MLFCYCISIEINMTSKQITICACSSRLFISNEKVTTVAYYLMNSGFEVKLVDDLCRMVADEPEEALQITEGTIVACHERAISSNFSQLTKRELDIVNLRSLTVQEILAKWNITEIEDRDLLLYKQVQTEVENLPTSEGKDAWYPIIDKLRCTNCGKCNDFCLFGTYTRNGDEILVIQPHNCKNNCPACARICPSGAIIFPKYEKSPINGGTAIEEEFSKDEMEAMYQKRLEYRLQQNRNRFSLLKKE